ncbi:hypothetical protein Droror1_Dr00012512 [Drosera rotundifolia]
MASRGWNLGFVDLHSGRLHCSFSQPSSFSALLSLSLVGLSASCLRAVFPSPRPSSQLPSSSVALSFALNPRRRPLLSIPSQILFALGGRELSDGEMTIVAIDLGGDSE